jgi:succinate-semialdehyde dehydrogenase/glutarate-semialdehyde dehydrogenase
VSGLADLPVAGIDDVTGDPVRLLVTLLVFDGEFYTGSSAVLALAGPGRRLGVIVGLPKRRAGAGAKAFAEDGLAHFSAPHPLRHASRGARTAHRRVDAVPNVAGHNCSEQDYGIAGCVPTSSARPSRGGPAWEACVSQVTSVPRSRIATVNPYTNEVLREFSPMSGEAIDHAVDAAHATFGAWRVLPVGERAAILGRAARLLRERGEELAHLVTTEMGKLIAHSRAEIDLSARILDYYAEKGPDLVADQPLEMLDGSAVLVTAPLGVLLSVQPWNFPVYQVVRFTGPNLVLGNTVLLKHASNTPQCALALERLFADAGVPSGAYTNMFLAVADIPRIIDNPRVCGVSLTGSDAAGASVGQHAGRNVKKTVLELGGSDPLIVLDGDNLERTVEAAFVGRMHNMGQSCVSAKRMMIMPVVFDDFVESLAARMRGLMPGDPADEETTLAPVVSEDAAEHLMGQIHDALDKGATAVIGGRRPHLPGAFVEPTILTGVTPKMRAFTEELFGPVAVVYRVEDDEAAVALANSSPYGLGGAVFARDTERARAVADRIESGMVWINHPTSSEPDLPFGGIKRSGHGRELSHLGIEEFANRKLVATSAPDAPIRDALG